MSQDKPANEFICKCCQGRNGKHKQVFHFTEQDNTDVRGYYEPCPAEKAIEFEQERWQQAIYELLKPHFPKVDGGGCDSDDPLDVTLSEIEQTIIHVEEKRNG